MFTPKLYVGTYQKYNAGSIQGAWLSLSDYDNAEQFYKACAELHKDEDDCELMFQDFEGFPEDMYSESGGVEELYELIDFINNSHLDAEIVLAAISIGISLDDDIEDAYAGSYDSDQDFAVQLAEETGFEEPTAWPYTCIDWKYAAREIMYDYSEENGHYFRNV